MSQITLLIKALKQHLKAQSKTYKDVAIKLNLAESSVKRMFADNHFTLKRLEEICDMLAISFSDLLHNMQQLSKHIDQLSWQQEETIVSEPMLTLVTICVINRWQYKDIIHYYKISEHQLINKLAQLDKLKVIELLPKNKFKLLISSGFTWIPNGPIQQYFQQHILNDFLQSNFQKDDEEMICRFGMLTPESNALLRKKIRLLAEEFIDLSHADSSESIDQRMGSACVFVLRPWAPRIFDDLIRK